MHLHLLTLVFGTAGLAVAQQHIVVPSAFADSEAPSLAGLAGATVAMRQQILIDPAHLTSAVGRTILALQLRRDTGFGRARSAQAARMIVRLGTNSVAPVEASTTLARNLGNAVEVFRGDVTFPATPEVSGYVGWVAPHIVDIRFTTGYAYSGGTLCIDLYGTPLHSAPPHWSVDAASDRAAGATTAIGAACGPYANAIGRSSGLAEADLVPGESALFFSRGEPGASAILLFGPRPRAVPLDLGFLGAPGCMLYIDAFAAATTVFARAELGAAFGGLANVVVRIPADQALLGGRLATQWIESGLALRTSEALDCRIASAPSRLGMATVTARPGEPDGRIDVTRSPVVRLELR